MWDNPYLPIAEIQRQAEELSEEERDVRIEGKYIIFGGNPVFNVRRLNRMLDNLKNDEPVSVGKLVECAA